MKKNMIRWSILLLLIAIAFWYYRNSLTEIWYGIQALTPLQILISCLLSMIFFLAEGYIIYTMAHPLCPNYHLANGIRTAFYCEFYRLLTLGSGSGIAAIYYLNKDGIPAGKGTSITTLQYVIKKLSVMILGVTGFLVLYTQTPTRVLIETYNTACLWGILITIAISAGMTLLVISHKIQSILLKLLHAIENKWPSRKEKIQKCKQEIIRIQEAGADALSNKKNLAKVFAADLIKLTATYAIISFVLWQNASIPIFTSLLLMAVSVMLAGVLPAPSGMGSLEFVYLLLFEAFADETLTIPAILLYRFVTWILPFVIGAVIFVIEKNNIKKP